MCAMDQGGAGVQLAAMLLQLMLGPNRAACVGLGHGSDLLIFEV